MKQSKGLQRLRTPIDFANLTAAQKRVEIAKDVIAALDANKIEAVQGTYGTVELKEYRSLRDSTDLRSLMPDMARCEVCAMGAVFVAAVGRENNFDINPEDPFWRAEDIIERLRGIFTPRQLRLMESAFEERGDVIGQKYAAMNLNDTERLKVIMNDIIDNGGTFGLR